jgi:hypothetical protein
LRFAKQAPTHSFKQQREMRVPELNFTFWEKAQPKSKDGKAMPEAGQFYGAVFQNRKYDSKGNLVK